MNTTNSPKHLELSEYALQAQTLVPDDAAIAVYRGSLLLWYAGFFNLAQQGFMHLTEGELKIYRVNSVGYGIEAIVPAMCYATKRPSPVIFSQPAMSSDELEKYIEINEFRYQRCHLFAGCRLGFRGLIASMWVSGRKSYVHNMTHPSPDMLNSDKARENLHRFLKYLHCQLVRSHLECEQARAWLKVFDDIIEAWQLDCQGEIEQKLLELGIVTYLQLDDINNADRYIKKWWQSNQSLEAGVNFITSLPAVQQRLAAGVLRAEIAINDAQGQAFVVAVTQRPSVYVPIPDVIPTVADWQHLLTQWDQELFTQFAKLDEKAIQHYQAAFPAVCNKRSALRQGATTQQIAALEARLGAQLPLNYKNFLLASNGFTILNEDCELYGTEQIKWFAEEHADWIEVWLDCCEEEYDEDVEADEGCLQYGEYQSLSDLKVAHMQTALQISSTEDGYVYLLNPKKIDTRGEWEAWDFGNKLAGAERHRSCWELLQTVYQRLLRLHNNA